MYVCVCYAVTDKELMDAVKLGYNTYPKLQEFLNVGNGCGCCKDDILDLIKSYSKLNLCNRF